MVRDDRVFPRPSPGCVKVSAVDRVWTTRFAIRSNCGRTRPSACLARAGVADGHVLVANAFGTGVLESPALRAFCPP
jgi:uncharacterized circularly permuted ATP-grasp superfamily protein